MATPSAQGMRDQGSMAQGVLSPQGQQRRGYPGGPQGVSQRPDVTSGQGQRSPVQGPPTGLSNPQGGPPGSPFQALNPGQMPAGWTPGGQAPQAPAGAPGTQVPAGGAPGAQAPPQAPQAAPARGPVPPGTTSPSGTPVNPDGSFTNPDGSLDWMVGYGPQRNYGAQAVRTGQAPTRPSPPEPDSAAPRGTPQWRQAYAERDAWIQENLRSGRSLADLGIEPVRGGGLSAYSRYGGMALQGGQGQGGAASQGPQSPQGIQTPQGPGTGGFLPGTENGFPGGGGLNDQIINLLMRMGGGGGNGRLY